MKTILAILLLLKTVQAYGQALTLGWDPPTNLPAASFGYVVMESSGGPLPVNFWACSNTNFVTPAIPAGISHWAVAQNPANAWGDGAQMLMSGEIEILCQPNVVVTATGTNSLIETSLDLGQTWVIAGTNVVIFPMSRAAQFFTSKNQKVSFTVSNAMSVVQQAP